MEEKTCTKCGQAFQNTSEYFEKQPGSKNGLGARCKACRAAYNKQYHEANKEAIAEQRRLYFIENFSHYKLYRETNKQAIEKRTKKWRAVNHEVLMEYSKAYCEAHKEEARAYYIANKETIATKGKLYRDAHKQETAERHKQWYSDNFERELIRSKKWYKNNPEQAAATRRKWGQDNPEKVRVKVQRRLARKKLLPNTLTPEQWVLAKEKFNGTCCYCGKEKPLTIEHFVPLSKMGELTINNVLPSCLSCNSSKGKINFFEWYSKFKHYSKNREQKILKYLNYENGIQQLSISM